MNSTVVDVIGGELAEDEVVVVVDRTGGCEDEEVLDCGVDVEVLLVDNGS